MVNEGMNISELLAKLNENPEMLKNAIDTARGLINSGLTENITQEQKNSDMTEKAPTSRQNQRIQLLNALRPFLNEERRKKLDNLIMILNLIEPFKNYIVEDERKEEA